MCGQGILAGESTLLLGCTEHDDAATSGIEVDVRVGDVVVLPAGTGHCNLVSSKEFRYVGVYPEVSLPTYLPSCSNQVRVIVVQGLSMGRV